MCVCKSSIIENVGELSRNRWGTKIRGALNREGRGEEVGGEVGGCGGGRGSRGRFVCWLVTCLMSEQRASLSQEQICSNDLYVLPY